MSRNSDFVATMEKRLKQWDTDVDALAARGEKASAVAREAYQAQLKDLRASRDAAQKKFKEMAVAAEAATAQMQGTMEATWNTMRKTLEKVSSDLGN